MKNPYIYFAFICLIVYACGTEDVFVPAEEPDITNSAEEFITQDFSITIDSKTDHDMYIKWYPVTDAASYEIVVNDLYVIRENIAKEEYLDYYRYKLTNLEADTEYKVTVRAMSRDLHAKTSTITEKTCKSFMDEVFQIKLDKYTYDFKGFTCFKRTSDGGSLILANINKNYSYKELIKLNPAFETEWICEIPDPGYEPYYFYSEPHLDLHEMKDGSYTLTTDKYAANISSSGNLRWKTKIAPEDAYFSSSVILPDECILLCGYSNRDRGKYIITGYYMAKLSADGSLLWEKHLDTPDDYMKRRYLTKSLYHNGKLLCCSQSDNASVVEFDLEGNILKEYIYHYPENNKVTFSEILPSSDGNYYLAGTVNYQYYVIKITGNGDIIWERKGYEDKSYTGNISSCNITAQNTVLFLEYSYNWLYGREIDNTGNIIEDFSWYNAPSNIYIGKDKENERYLYVTMYGEIIFINPDGYKE